MRAFLAMACALAIAACGGKAFTDEIDGGDGSAGDGSSGTDGSAGDAGSTDGGMGNDASPKPDASPQDCAKLSQELDQLRLSARKCCPACNVVQCDHAAPDLCCSFSYSTANQQAVDQFEQKMKEFEALCGPVNCPAIPCQPAPSLRCDPNTSLCQ